MITHNPTTHVHTTRRQVMIGAASLSFAFAFQDTTHAATLALDAVGKPLNPWVSIAPDDTITIMSAATEMGQGSMTSLPLVLAEELDADWARVKIVPAPVIDEIYGNPAYFGMIYTAGSNAVHGYFNKLRMFGAQIRKVLLDNAAKKLAVPVDELTTEPSVVFHAKTGRRISYGEIAVFADIPEKAPEIKPEQLKKTQDFRLIGKDVMRTELPQKVNGSAPYSIDVQLPGMVYGAVVRAPVEGAEPIQFDDAKIRSVPDVITSVKLPYGVGVIAKTPWAAFAARQIIADSATWTKTAKGWTFNTDQGLDAFVTAARDLSQPATEWWKVGDAIGELNKAVGILDGIYVCDCAYHAQIEPLNAVASVSATGNSAEVWTGTQSPTTASEATAKALGISRDRVKVNYMLMGGGFGRRGPRNSDFTVDAVLLSKEAARPVKVMWTREDDIHNGRFRPLSAHLLRAGFDSAENLIAVQHRNVGDRVTADFDPVRYEWLKHRDGILMAGGDLAGYDVAHQLVEQIYQDTGTRTAPLRGIGFLANKFAVETFIDELALKRSRDPLEFRLNLMKKNRRGARLLERASEMAGWQHKRDGRGLGVAFINYSGTQLACIAEVSVDRASGTIRVHELWCTIDCGIAVQPDNIIAQTEGSIIYGLGAALTERITFKDGVVEQSNFYDYLVPRMETVPIVHVELLQTENPPTGVGQMGAPLGAPVVGNAIANLTGVRLRHSPFTPERVKAALG